MLEIDLKKQKNILGYSTNANKTVKFTFSNIRL